MVRHRKTRYIGGFGRWVLGMIEGRRILHRTISPRIMVRSGANYGLAAQQADTLEEGRITTVELVLAR